MKNFPTDFGTALKDYIDGKGVCLDDRAKRLSAAIDLFWQSPGEAAAQVRLNRRISKLLRGLNYNHLFRQRIEFQAAGVGPYNANLEGDGRTCVILDENDLMASFEAIRPLFRLHPTADNAGSILRGLGVLFLNYFVLHLHRCAVACCREEKPPPFPGSLLEQVEGLIAEGAIAWCADTVIRDRLRAVHTVHAASLLTPDQKTRVIEVSRLMAKIEGPGLVPEDVAARIRICELYHSVWPYLRGKRAFRREGAEHQNMVLRDTSLLAKYLCRREKMATTPAQAELRIRTTVAKRIVRAVGRKNDDLGWHLYRELRGGDRRHRFRTDYIFRELLDDDTDRLAVLNVVYEHKKQGLKLNDPKRKRVYGMIAKKYQRYFSDVLELDKATDTLTLVHEESRLDLGNLMV